MTAFPGTRHSIVAAIRSDRTDVRRSAVFKYVRLKMAHVAGGRADLTQGFFLRAFEKDFFAGFDSSRARFRIYPRISLDGFVSNQSSTDTSWHLRGSIP